MKYIEFHNTDTNFCSLCSVDSFIEITRITTMDEYNLPVVIFRTSTEEYKYVVRFETLEESKVFYDAIMQFIKGSDTYLSIETSCGFPYNKFIRFS